MLKKSSLFMLSLIILLSMCGCGNKENKAENKDTKEDFTYINTINGLENENVILTQSNLVVTDNNFYSVSFDKLYSNDTNYKQIEGVSNLIGIQYEDFEIYALYDNKGNRGYYDKDNSIEKGSLDLKSTFNYDFKLKNGIVYVDNENKIYITKFFVNSENYYDNYEKNGTLVEDNPIPSEENIISIYLSNGNKYYLKTNKAFYSLKQKKKTTNKEQCEKYEDIKCEYVEIIDIKKEEKLTKHLQDIKYITNDKIVFNNNKVFSLN